jgi:nicotinamide-nucleotide amidase
LEEGEESVVAITEEIISLTAEIHKALRERNETLSTAESITAGGLSNALTIVPGASEVFLGGAAAYHPTIKVSLLGVSEETISKHSVFSQEVAVEMAQGALKTFGTTWAIATTGVAGPGPTEERAAGCVWVAIAGPINQTMELDLAGEREVVRNATIASAIASFARILRHRKD